MASCRRSTIPRYATSAFWRVRLRIASSSLKARSGTTMINAMPKAARRLARLSLLLLVLAGFYFLAAYKHNQREAIRQAPVALTPACAEKLARYALTPG